MQDARVLCRGGGRKAPALRSCSRLLFFSKLVVKLVVKLQLVLKLQLVVKSTCDAARSAIVLQLALLLGFRCRRPAVFFARPFAPPASSKASGKASSKAHTHTHTHTHTHSCNKRFPVEYFYDFFTMYKILWSQPPYYYDLPALSEPIALASAPSARPSMARSRN